ncbi:MAG: glycine cleavage system protein GcvH [Candidatus Jordarchaeum sp.]|uniref:glycine cleavage system protein GcvH n=1 Tax=Candidatus Jordarchaeum sp. TaxID=2823881 RepID=UPI004048FC5E
MNIPDDLLYIEEHQWAKIEGEKVRVGITDYAQKSLRDIVYVELPESGTEVDSMSEFGSIESVKAVSELYAPVSGEIVEVNSELEDAPEFVNEDPYGKGWMIVIKASKLNDERGNLISAEEYAKIVEDALKESG